jgi:hypothetical protein
MEEKRMFISGFEMSEHKEFEKDVKESESREKENLDLHERDTRWRS